MRFGFGRFNRVKALERRVPTHAVAFVVSVREEFSLTKLEEMLDQARRQCVEKGLFYLLLAIDHR